MNRKDLIYEWIYIFCIILDYKQVLLLYLLNNNYSKKTTENKRLALSQSGVEALEKLSFTN